MQVCVCVSCGPVLRTLTLALQYAIRVSVSVIFIKWQIYWGSSFGHGRSSVLLSDPKSLEVWDPLSILRGQAFLSADMAESLSLKYLGMANLHQIAQNP